MQEVSNLILLRIRNIKKNKIVHSLKKLDRCCKSAGWDHTVNGLRFGGIDEVKRILCNITKNAFLKNYVMQRKHVILKNCTDTWKANNWTFKGNLNFI